ncbi:MAG: exodeoxyribonuclease VII small subunit [Synergistaceae bacterium]|nr:exodeoxyribonuclease VII small subunit [Synergistaceae bacterium]
MSDMSFSDDLDRLDEILRRLETEPIPLDEAIAMFEEGSTLVKEGERQLTEAEQRVTILSEEEAPPLDAPSREEDL